MAQKIDVGQVINKVFDIYRDQAGVLLPVALAIYLGVAILAAILAVISPILILLALIIQFIAGYFYAGMVVQLVADVQDGRRDSSVGDLFNSVTGVVAPLIGAAILAGIAIGIGFLLLIVPGLFLLTIWAVVAPVIVLERPGVIAAFGRSRELVRGNGWQVLGTIVLFVLILFVASLFLGAIGAALGDVGRAIMNLVANVLAAPLFGLATAVLYFTLRSAKGEAGAPPGAVGLEQAPAGGPAAPAAPQPGAPQPEAPQPGAPQPEAPQPPAPDPTRPESPPPGGQQQPPG
jgi:hypothetical protein